ncbi:MAG: flagellar hook-basal body complex protein FliE [Sulfitobacter sp.]
MDVKPMNALHRYSAARPVTQPNSDPHGAGTALKAAAGDFAETLAQSEATATASMTGDADPHALVLALAQTELAVETAVTLRNKVVEAYQEILRMPV